MPPGLIGFHCHRDAKAQRQRNFLYDVHAPAVQSELYLLKNNFISSKGTTTLRLVLCTWNSCSAIKWIASYCAEKSTTKAYCVRIPVQRSGANQADREKRHFA